ncbi:MAG: TlpA family protein disulfide reductase [Gammaproteobacteria bacterium]|nr:TlpA family protein disulfide reductase [Gammaproteobacteria bacterium]
MPAVVKIFRLLLLLSVGIIYGCAGQQDVEPAKGIWRAEIELPGGILPFQLEISGAQTGGYEAFYVNGEERVPVREFSIRGNELAFVMPAFNSRIRARLENDKLTGELSVIKTGAEEQLMPFRAVYDKHHRFFEMLQPPQINVAGRWEVVFVDDEGVETEAVGEFQQDGSQVYGTFLTPTSDYRYLAGEVRGRDLYLSAFDGYHVFLFKAEMDSAGRLSGDFWSGTKWHESWTAARNEQAALADADKVTFLKEGYERFDFTFPDLNGEPVSLSDEKFRDKVVIVTLVGSWCPNCHDEAGFLAPFYKANKDRGVEIVALMFEHFGDFENAARQTREFREKFDIQYTTLIAGVSDKDEASKSLPMLNRLLAFPTTIFIDAHGEVRLIHTGFSGPGTGEHYEKLKTNFTELVNILVAEREAGGQG